MEIFRLKNEALQLSAKIEAAESELEKMKVELREILRNKIPEALFAAGVSEITDSSDSVKISTVVKSDAKLPARDDPARKHALDWLEDNGHGEIIKSALTVEAEKNQLSRLRLMQKTIEAQFPGSKISVDRDVHFMTLRGTINDLISFGIDVPRDLFNVTSYTQTKLERKK